MKTLNIINGDLLEAKEQYIAHQCNCVSAGRAAGLASLLFYKYPYSDVYKTRKNHSVPGTISIHGDGLSQRYVINMYAQYYPGKFRNEFSNDSNQMRQQYFKKCLEDIANIENLQSIAMPFNIGCGLAGGKWEDYSQILTDFINSTPIELVLYQK